MTGLEEMYSRVEASLRLHGYHVERIRYPDDPMKRSIDIVAVGSDGRTILVKIVHDAADLSVGELRELQACSRVLRGRGLIVAEKDEGAEIDPIVAHEKMGLYTVSVEGLEAALSESIYVVRRQGNYYMYVNGGKLREKRLEKGYSLGDVASMISTSRRSVYMYEQGGSMVSLRVALKLMELFSEDIFKPIDILSPVGQEEQKQSRKKPKSKLASILYTAGYDVAETRHVPPNALAADSEGRIVVVAERKRSDDMERRVEESERVAKRIEAIVVSIGSDAVRRIAGRYDVYTVSSYDELAELVMELKRSQEEQLTQPPDEEPGEGSSA